MRIGIGSHVRLHYTLKDEQGGILYASSEPVEFVVGQGDVLPAFEAAIMAMAAGEKRTFTLKPEEAFGPYQPAWVFRISRKQFENVSEPIQPGQVLLLTTAEGDTLQVYVLDVDEETIEVDANHPLAGHTLTYTVEILSVE
ncbi:MAG: peptidylprolyl isomerase [Bacteroidia bacterium]|nr:peptidylprolyl isomerase [Bacteroidia bacterium]MDW8089696.1 peptidylprolyl isomerase [Bacteroidia bacterium]